MHSDVYIEDLLAPNYDALLEDVLAHRHSQYMLKGGRGSLKSSFTGFVIPLIMLEHPDGFQRFRRRLSRLFPCSFVLCAFLLLRLIPPYQVDADAVLFLRRRFALWGIRQRHVLAEGVLEKPVTGLGVSRRQILLHFLHDDERLNGDILFLRFFQRVNVVWVGYCALAVAHSQHRTDNL